MLEKLVVHFEILGVKRRPMLQPLWLVSFWKGRVLVPQSFEPYILLRKKPAIPTWIASLQCRFSYPSLWQFKALTYFEGNNYFEGNDTSCSGKVWWEACKYVVSLGPVGWKKDLIKHKARSQRNKLEAANSHQSRGQIHDISPHFYMRSIPAIKI